LQAGRFKYAPQGLFGAGPGIMAKFLINDKDGDPSGLTLCQKGDVIQFISAGGGGYGNAFERDPAAVEQDVRNGYVSLEKAREQYGVVVDPGSLEVDLAATGNLRALKKRE
jgi:N-methylhydantoinase B